MKNKATGSVCCSFCSFNFPEIPTQWLLFFDFAFTFGTTIVYFADIVTDIITLGKYSYVLITLHYGSSSFICL